MKISRTTIFVTRGALIASLYIAFTYIAAFLGLSSGIIQFRISEALCVLPVFMPEAVPGLFIGCLLSNALTGCALWDIIFGSIATLLGCLGAILLRRLPSFLLWMTTVPTIIANSLIVPLVLIYAYGAEGGYWLLVTTVFIGEAVCAGIGGSILLYTLKRKNFKSYRKDEQ